jgi:hypothetical protein
MQGKKSCARGRQFNARQKVLGGKVTPLPFKNSPKYPDL